VREAGYERYRTNYFKNAITKYGNSLIWEVIERDIPNITAAYERETYWINFYRSYDNNIGYNTSFGGPGVLPTEETRAKISRSTKIAMIRKFKDPRYKEYRQEIGRETVRKNRDKMVNGIRRTRSTEESRAKSSSDSSKRYSDVTNRDNMAIACGGKPFNVYDIYGNFIGRWISQKQCARDLAFPSSKYIGYCLRGIQKSYRNYVFKYISNF
jgi:hypothetical protein